MPPRRPRGKSASSELVDLTGGEDGDRDGDGNGDEGEEHTQILAVVEGVPITERHRRILLDPHEWLTDEIINAYCTKISAGNAAVHCCSTFFYTRISQKRPAVEWLRRWKRTVQWPKESVFVPINWSNSHWSLICYSSRKNTLQYYDSMMASARSQRALQVVKDAFEACGVIERPPEQARDAVGVLAFVLSRISVSRAASAAPAPLKLETPPNQPQQADGSSCGVFLCWWVSKLSSPPPPSLSLSRSLPARPSCNPASFRKNILDTIIK